MSLNLAMAVNPRAGGGRARAVGARLLHRLRSEGHRVTVLGKADQLGTLAECHEAVRRGIDQLVVVGGDGVAHVGINATAGTGTPLMIVPAGSGNDLARQVDQPFHDPAAAAAAITAGRTRVIDCGRVVDGAPGACGPWFGNVVAIGFDAKVALRAASWERGFVGPLRPLKYPMAIAAEVAAFSAQDYRLSVDGVSRDLRAVLVAIGNGTTYGGGVKMVPDAVLDDGLLTCTIVHETSRWTLARMFSSIFSGEHTSHSDVEVVSGTRIGIGGVGASVGDGEPFSELPATFEAVPGALTLVLPAPRGSFAT